VQDLPLSLPLPGRLLFRQRLAEPLQVPLRLLLDKIVEVDHFWVEEERVDVEFDGEGSVDLALTLFLQDLEQHLSLMLSDGTAHHAKNALPKRTLGCPFQPIYA